MYVTKNPPFWFHPCKAESITQTYVSSWWAGTGLDTAQWTGGPLGHCPWCTSTPASSSVIQHFLVLLEKLQQNSSRCRVDEKHIRPELPRKNKQQYKLDEPVPRLNLSNLHNTSSLHTLWWPSPPSPLTPLLTPSSVSPEEGMSWLCGPLPRPGLTGGWSLMEWLWRDCRLTLNITLLSHCVASSQVQCSLKCRPRRTQWTREEPKEGPEKEWRARN